MKEDINVTLGSFFRSKRIENSLTGRELSQKLKVSQQQISKHERGLCNFSIQMIMNYCLTLDIPPHEIMRKVFNSENKYP